MNFKLWLETNSELDKLVELFQSKYPNVKIWVSEKNNRIEISEIMVPQDSRNQGIGSEFVKLVQDYAKNVGKPIVLRPEPERGKKGALDRFYKRLNFVNNTGRNMDYELSSPVAKTMYWRP